MFEDSDGPQPISIASIRDESSPQTLNQDVPNIQSLHSIPFHVYHTGTAPVSSFFKTETNDSTTKIATFRGHPLFGNEIQLSNGYQFYLMSEEKMQENENKSQKLFKVKSTSSSLVFWKYDNLSEIEKKQIKDVLRVTQFLAS